MKYNWIKSNKKQTVRNSCHGRVNWKRAFILSVTIQVDKKVKQMWDNNTNKRKVYNKFLNNNKITISIPIESWNSSSVPSRYGTSILKRFPKSLMCETNIAGEFSLSLIRMDAFETQNDTIDFLDHSFLHFGHKNL